MQFTTTSPSSSSRRRSTPCVDGCLRAHVQQHGFTGDGGVPKLNACIGQPESLAVDIHSWLFPGIRFAQVNLFKVEGKLRLFIAQRIILAKRMAFPIIGHQIRRGSGWPSNSMPNISRISRSRQLAAWKTCVAVGILSRPSLTGTLNCNERFCVSEVS